MPCSLRSTICGPASLSQSLPVRPSMAARSRKKAPDCGLAAAARSPIVSSAWTARFLLLRWCVAPRRPAAPPAPPQPPPRRLLVRVAVLLVPELLHQVGGEAIPQLLAQRHLAEDGPDGHQLLFEHLGGGSGVELDRFYLEVVVLQPGLIAQQLNRHLGGEA